jgi:hypothetical protein
MGPRIDAFHAGEMPNTNPMAQAIQKPVIVQNTRCIDVRREAVGTHESGLRGC